MRKPLASLLAVLVAFCLVAAPAAASTTRLLSLGLDNWQLDDEVNQWTNPALLRSSPDLGLFEMGTQSAGAGNALDAGSQWGGFHKSVGDSAVFALYVRRPYQLNDFNASATALTTPVTGGGITADGVLGQTGMPGVGTAVGQSNNANQWTTSGPFGAGGSALGITGAPNMTRTLAVPQNYADLMFAWAWGAMDWGLHFNYARNKGGEVSRQRYEQPTGTDGSMEVHRLSQEFNTRLGWRWNGWRNTWMQMALDSTVPDFHMKYEEARANGAYSRSRIDGTPMVSGGFLFQLGHKNESESLWSVTVRGAVIDDTAVAEEAADANHDGTLDTERTGYWTNTRKFAAADFTWVRPFDRFKSTLVASLGAEHTYVKQTYQFTDVLTPANNIGDEARVTSILFPLRVAMETQPWDYVALRAGLQKNVFSSSRSRLESAAGLGAATINETDTDISDPNGTADGVGLSFGVGLKLVEGLSWDSVVRQRLLFDGPQFIGGQANGLFAQTTLVYRWGQSNPIGNVSLKPLIPLKRLFSGRG